MAPRYNRRWNPKELHICRTKDNSHWLTTSWTPSTQWVYKRIVRDWDCSLSELLVSWGGPPPTPSPIPRGMVERWEPLRKLKKTPCHWWHRGLVQGSHLCQQSEGWHLEAVTLSSFSRTKTHTSWDRYGTYIRINLKGTLQRGSSAPALRYCECPAWGQ